MAHEGPTGEHTDGPRGDPWMAFGYVVSGVFLYGFIGWLLDRWLGTTFLVAIGILIGAGLGLFQTFARFGFRSSTVAPPHNSHDQPS